MFVSGRGLTLRTLEKRDIGTARVEAGESLRLRTRWLPRDGHGEDYDECLRYRAGQHNDGTVAENEE